VTANEDFLFAQEAIAQGFVTEAQVEEGLLLQKRMAEDLKLDERLGVILVKRGYLAEDQARRVYARIEPDKAGEIRGYRLLDVIGRGAMGTVYRALHLGLNREVAVKVLRPDLVGDRTQVERLRAEAKMLADLDHPNVIRALDAGESNGFPFVAMEYVEGETLRDKLRREGPLPEPEALRITRAIADALERARRMGIVHRDVKPGNVLMARNGTPKLMDLGLAKGPIDLGLTQHGATVGTPQYISPEQAVDPKKADTRSDIYSLGATLYAMLVGKPPFDGQTLAEILTKVLYEVPVPVRTLRPEVSPEAGYLVERMMLRDPSLRYRTPALVVEDIDRLQQGTSILPTGFSGNWEAYLLRKRARKTLVVGGAVAAVALLGFGGWRLWAAFSEGRETRAARIQAAERALGATNEIPATADEASIAQRLARVQAALDEMGDEDLPRHRLDLVKRRTALSHVLTRLQDLAILWRDAVEPAAATGNFAGADAALEGFARANAGNEPVERAAREARRSVRDRSDAALKDARSAWQRESPASFDDVVRLARAWGEATQSGFATTDALLRERGAAQDAMQAAAQIDAAARLGRDPLAPAEVDALLARRDFAELRRRLDAGPRSALDELDKRLDRLAPLFGERTLRALVEAPFDEARRQAEERVEDAAFAAIATADRLAAAREFAAAIEHLKAFADAVGDSFDTWIVPEHRRAIEGQRDLGLAEASARWDRLLVDVVAALQARDAQAARERVRAEEGSRHFDAFPEFAARFESLRREFAAYDDFWRRAFAGLSTHVGPAPERWLDTVRLATGEPARKWEVRSVDPATLTFVIVSHAGNTVGRPETKGAETLSDEQWVALAGEAPRPAPADEARSHAMFELVRAPTRTGESDFYLLLRVYERVRDLFEQGDDAGGPLAAHVRALIGALEREAAEHETQATRSLVSMRQHVAAAQYDLAGHHIDRLKRAPLVHTKAVKGAWAELERESKAVEAGHLKNQVQRLLPGAHVNHRQGDQYDVDIAFDFNSEGQTSSVVSGLARLIPFGQETALTPGSGEANRALRLLPDDAGRLVTNRPLAFENPFDDAFEVSMAFELHLRGHTPFFLAVDLGGVVAGVLSADPRHLKFPPGTPAAPKEKDRSASEFDFYGRGRGVLFHVPDPRSKRPGALPGFGEPHRWRWEEGHQGRHFVGRERDLRERDPDRSMLRRWFAFESREKPYRVKVSRRKDAMRLEVDGQAVWEETDARFASAARTGLLQILTYTTCDIDNVLLSGRVSEGWLARKEAERKPAK
jgi:serine/threonine-protein kinase